MNYNYYLSRYPELFKEGARQVLAAFDIVDLPDLQYRFNLETYLEFEIKDQMFQVLLCIPNQNVEQFEQEFATPMYVLTDSTGQALVLLPNQPEDIANIVHLIFDL